MLKYYRICIAFNYLWHAAYHNIQHMMLRAEHDTVCAYYIDIYTTHDTILIYLRINSSATVYDTIYTYFLAAVGSYSKFGSVFYTTVLAETARASI
jgi:hypothetical protein